MDIAAMPRIGIAIRAYERTETPLRRLEDSRLAGGAVLMLVGAVCRTKQNPSHWLAARRVRVDLGLALNRYPSIARTPPPRMPIGMCIDIGMVARINIGAELWQTVVG